MQRPVKPWEADDLPDSAGISSILNTRSPVNPVAPPTLPSRTVGGYPRGDFDRMGYGSTMGGGFGGSYGGYGGGYGSGYSSYGRGMGMGMGMSRYGYSGGMAESAEASSRSAFSGIESIVSAFVNIAQMLESTYEAMFSSFRAVIGVADQFGRLKGHLIGLVSAVALLRWLRRMMGRALILLGITPPAYLTPVLAPSDFQFEEGAEVRARSWPFIVFFAVAIGGPYLIWRYLVAPETQRAQKDTRKPVTARAVWDFDASRSDEISFRIGDNLTIFPPGPGDSREWLKAELDGKTGLIPANYVRLIRDKPPETPSRRPSKNGDDGFEAEFGKATTTERIRTKNSRDM